MFRRITQAIFMSEFNTPTKIIFSIGSGILAAVFCNLGFKIVIDTTSIDLPWSVVFPAIISMAFGWRYGLLAGLSGGVYFPFILWAEDGWANVTTAIEYLLLYTALGATNITTTGWWINNRIYKIILVLIGYNIMNISYDFFLFNRMLSLNPAFWEPNSITWLTPDIVLGFGVKDGINIFTIVLLSETLLCLPAFRRLLGIRSNETMSGNHKIFLVSILIPFVIWFMFIGLGYWLLRDNKALQYEHKSFALFVIILNGLLVSRLLCYFNENRLLVTQKLNVSETKYKRLFENVQDVFFQLQPDGQITDISPSILKLSEYSPHELAKSNNKPSINIGINSSEVLNTVIDKGEILDYETELYTKSGIRKIISINAQLIPESNHQSAHIDGTLRDITERKKYQQEVVEKNEKLRIQNKELEQFAYIASHDLQEPLQNLLSVSKLMQLEFQVQDSSQKQYLSFIEQSTFRMKSLIYGLMEYYRIGQEVEQTTIDLNELVKQILSEFEPLIELQKTNITIGKLPVLTTGQRELKLLFSNLIHNALKFNKADRNAELSISSFTGDNFYHFKIQDNGIGIDDKNKDKIFMVFKRLNNRDEYEGLGIGLAQSKKIINLLGGKIWYESKVGSGTTFHFTIPF
jgi:PAS domain S-box-containing protein